VNPSPRFLTVDDVLTLHAIAIEDQGGDPSLRDRGLLESAIATPAQQFAERYLHEDIPAMAAAYAFHISKNHPFVDGNKRAATAAMIAFLSDNGWSFDALADEAEPIILQLAAGLLDKPAFTDWARTHMHEKPRMELREFFRTIDPEKFMQRYDALLREAPGQTLQQLQATVDETAGTTSLIPLFVHLNKVAVQRNDESARISTATAIFVFCTLNRLAEDMGYEW
jgi:death on curing protein